MSKTDNSVDPVWHRDQIEQYAAIEPIYSLYAKALLRVLGDAKKLSIPEAIVQARPKAIASFAEKCVRKYEKYKDPVNQLTDLCGGRVIVHTLDQVEAVRLFIKHNFKILEEDEKGLMLGKDKFGYRDLHFLIRLKADRAEAIGFTKDEIASIGGKIAELQIRTVVQHAWADILHDRMYKTKLIYPPEFQRQGSLLAAIMEDGDRQFNGLAYGIDGMLANFNVYAKREEVEKEIEVQRIIHENAAAEKKPAAALSLARLQADMGCYQEVCDILTPHAKLEGALRFEILLELGFALCKIHAQAPTSAEYRQGQEYLKQVADESRKEVFDYIPNVRKRKGMLARALTRLAWSYQSIRGGASEARNCYREALRTEPGNPYYLSEMLAYEIECTRRTDMVLSMESSILAAIATCRQHACNGTELPFACFTAGRLLLLLNRPDEALGEYAHGMRHLKSGSICVPEEEVLELEVNWIYRVIGPEEPANGYRWILDLIGLYRGTGCAGCKAELTAPVMIVAGSAGKGITGEEVDRLADVFSDAVSGMEGTVISGGTLVGVPKSIADGIAKAKESGHSAPNLIGYLPLKLPTDVQADTCCSIVSCGENDFSPAQLLCYWKDILAAGVNPENVIVLGYGGGSISKAEYAIALMLKAEVYLIRGSGREADALLEQEGDIENLKGIPNDSASIWALFRTAATSAVSIDESSIETMAKAFHANYVAENPNRMPGNMQPWDALKDTYKHANLEQARYAISILEAAGFSVQRTEGTPVIFTGFTDEEVERMSELEHGRWNAERLRSGWRFGETRDDKLQLHNNIVPWDVLPDGEDGVKKYDRNAVLKFPEILAEAGLEISRK